MPSDFDLSNFLLSYLALFITMIGCEMTLAYFCKVYASDCVEFNDLVDNEGRITFNPLRYIDFFGTIIFPVGMLLFNSPILFGWSKMIGVNTIKVMNRYGLNIAILLASSGVFFHFFCAFLASIVLSYTANMELGVFLQNMVLYNVFFAVIKLCPLLPYDGLRILSYIGLKFGSETLMRFYFKIMPYSIFIFAILIFTPLKVCIMYPAFMIFDFLL